VEHLFCQERLRAATVQPREEEAQGHLTNVQKYLKGQCEKDRARLFSVVPIDRASSKGHKLEHRRFPLNKETLCFLTVMEYCYRLPKDIVVYLSMEIFRSCLDKFLRSWL